MRDWFSLLDQGKTICALGNSDTHQRNGDRLRMRATYTVPLEFPGYTYHWNFDHQVDVPIFIF